MRDFFMVTGLVLMIITLLALYVIPPLVLLVATFAWKGKRRAQAWLPVPIFLVAFWLLSLYSKSKPDLDGGEMWGVVVIGGATVLYYAWLFRLGYGEQRAKLPPNPATPAH